MPHHAHPTQHDDRHHRRTWRQFFQVMGPGIVSGAADNDPAGVVTYVQVGATTGTGLLWLMLLSTPMLYYLEEMSTRLGIVTKRGICRNLRTHYSHGAAAVMGSEDRKSTRLNSSHTVISYAVFCLKKKKKRARSRVEPRAGLLDQPHSLIT